MKREVKVSEATLRIKDVLQDARLTGKDLDQVVEDLYASLRAIAGRQLSRERYGHTLSATALVNETYLRLQSHFPEIPDEKNKFLRIASRLMRHVLVDYARSRQRDKRGGGLTLNTYTDALEVVPDEGPDNLLQVDELLERLEQRNPQHCRIIECRFFAGMSIEETAEVLETSVSSVKRSWRFARTWLQAELNKA